MTILFRPSAAAFVVLTAGVFAACGGGGTNKTPGTPTTPTAPAAPAPVNTWSASGQVTAVASSQSVGGATVTPGWSLPAVTADAQGFYELGAVANPPSTPYPVSISASGMMTRETWITWAKGPRSGVNVSLISESAPFSRDFYRQFVRGMFDHAGDADAPYPNFRWTMAPSFYVRTIDSVGRAVEPEVLAVTLDGLRRAVPAYTGGTYQPNVIETGTEVRPEAAGWINVDFMRNTGGNTCGTSYVGRNPGVITLYIDVCSCGSNKVPGAVTMHEVGHAMGFFHVSDRNSLMFPVIPGACPAGVLSAAEAHHAAVAYARPRGNRDPDRDPVAGASLTGGMAGGGPLVR